MSRITNILGGILLIACVVLGGIAYHEHGARVKAEAVAAAAKADQAAAKVYTPVVKAATTKHEAAATNLENVIAHSSTSAAVAATPVPDDLADLLRDPAHKAK